MAVDNGDEGPRTEGRNSKQQHRKVKGTKPKMILKRGSNTPVQLKHARQSEAGSDVVGAEDRGTNRKHKNPRGGGDDVVTDSHELGDQNPDSKKLQKGQKDQKKRKEKADS